jgi:3-deoxy-D-manno-octulosonic-acid transferase
MLLLYNFLSTIAVLLYIPRLFTKKGPEDRKVFIRERLGMSDYSETDIWVHAVSVGEVLASQPFIKKLKKEFPSKRIVLTTTTYTGQKIAQERFPEVDRVMYMPVDTHLCIRRVVNSLRPELFISAETELWPALFHELKQARSRIVILNGRISNASYKGYRRISFIMRKVLANVDFLYMQSEEDAKKIIDIGADSVRVGVMGNFKFDIEIDSNAIPGWQNNIRGNIILAASTHKGEDEIILDAYAAVKQIAERNKNLTASDLKLIIAPRHPERFDEVAGIFEKRGLEYMRRSALDSVKSTNDIPDIILLDSMGELSGLFSIAAIAFIGGSLVPTGGHNILEPAYYSKPIIFGPHMDNFPIAGDFLASSAALEVKDSNDIANAVIELLSDNEQNQ